MPIRARLVSTWRTLFRKQRLDADLDDELRSYVDDLTRRHMRSGLDAEEARRAARIEAGGIEQVKEQVRDARAGRRVDTLLQDVRYAWRGLGRAPLFTAVVVATLALGIGANTAIYSVIDAVLLRPVPVPDIDRLVMLWETDRQTGTTREPASIPDYVDFRARTRTVDRLGAVVAGEANLTPPAGDPLRLAVLRLTRDLLPMLGVRPLVGRHFTDEEDRAGGQQVVLISESLWERALARDPDVIGKAVRLDDVPYMVVGVVPDAADFGVLQILTAAAYSRAFADRGDRLRVDAWLPLRPDPKISPRETHPIFVLGRLRAGVDCASAQREFDTIARDLERTYPVNEARGVHVEPLAAVVFGPVRPALILLLGAVALVLLVACVNVANLLLARGTTRAREIAIRAALGAGGRRLAAQFLIESLILASMACAAGVLLAHLALTTLVAMAPPGIPRVATAAIDWRVLAVALAVALAVGVAFGLLPTLQARRLDLQGALTADAGRQIASSPGARRLRRALVVVELALAVMLLAGAALLVRSLWNVEHVDAGFRTDGVLKAEYQLPAARYPVDLRRWPNFTEVHAFNDGLIRRAAAIPGVESVAVAGNHPLDAGFTNSFVIVGREAESRSFPEISVRRVTPGYFRTVGLALVGGRLLDDGDGTNAAPVLVINQAARRRFFPNGDAVGQRIRFWGATRRIVGVVADERFHGLAAAAPIAVYAPLAQAPSVNGAGVLLVRTAGEPTALTSVVRKAFHDQDPQLAVFGVEPLSRTVAQSLTERRFLVVLLALFAGLALTLASIGVHGVMAYSVARRTREFGVRMALGARPMQVLRAVLGEAFVLMALGLAIGAGGALAMTRFLSAYLFGVAAADPLTFGAVAGFLGLATVIAAGVPARRATQVDPTVALRAE